MKDTFTCSVCLKVRDFHSQAVVMGCHPDDAEMWITGMPCVFTGFCLTCMDEES